MLEPSSKFRQFTFIAETRLISL